MKSNEIKNASMSTYNLIFVSAILISFAFLFVKGFKGGYEKFDENFFQRFFIIQNFNRLKIKLGDRVFPSVLIGNDMWMNFVTSNNMDDFQNASDLTEEEVREIGSLIAECHKFAHEEGFTFLIVVAPNKETIYPEMVPSEIVRISDRNNIDNINAELRELGVPEMLDLRPSLLSGKDGRQIYYATDTHWNGYGSYIGYREIILQLSNNYPALSPFPEEFFRIKEIPVETPKDLAKIIQTTYILEKSIEPRKKKELFEQISLPDGISQITLVQNEELPSLLMLHDSFGISLIDYLSSNFERAIYVRSSDSNSYLNRTTIGYYNPDIVLYQVVERYLFLLKNHLTDCAKN